MVCNQFHPLDLPRQFFHARPRSKTKINYNRLARIEGTAILVAVMVVAGVGSFVDYKKELQFVKSRHKSDEKNVVSIYLVLLSLHPVLILISPMTALVETAFFLKLTYFL